MKHIKLYEAIDKYHRPSDNELSELIVKYKKTQNRVVNNNFLIQSILTFFRKLGVAGPTVNDLDNINTVSNWLINPPTKYGSGLVKSDFIDEFYFKLKMDTNEDKERIEDAFLDILPGLKTTIVSNPNQHSFSYKVRILHIKSDDIPDVIRSIIKTCSKRIPTNYRMGEIIISGGSISIDIHPY